jgi:hypothetical protein
VDGVERMGIWSKEGAVLLVDLECLANSKAAGDGLKLMNTKIEWEYSGKPDELMGTGATKTEKTLAYLSGLIVPIFLVFLGVKGIVHWTWWQWIISIAIGADISAGSVANALNSCKRFYHSSIKPGEEKYRLAKNPVFFSTLHIYPLIIWFAFDRANWMFAVVWYTLLIFSTWVIGQIPLYLRRPVSILIVVSVILANAYLLSPVPGFEWLAPLLFLKIIAGHSVREEPYRPA